jgi:hypothetical protein
MVLLKGNLFMIAWPGHLSTFISAKLLRGPLLS